MDFAERAARQWAQRYPDVDSSHILVIGRILRIAAAVTARSELELAEHGLTRGEFDLLCALRRADCPLRPGEITTVTEASPAAITKRLDRLSGQGLVRREQVQHDRRSVLVSMTEAGRALLDAVFPAIAASEAQALAGLDPAQSGELAELLGVVLATVDPEDFSPSPLPAEVPA